CGGRQTAWDKPFHLGKTRRGIDPIAKTRNDPSAVLRFRDRDLWSAADLALLSHTQAGSVGKRLGTSRSTLNRESVMEDGGARDLGDGGRSALPHGERQLGAEN